MEPDGTEDLIAELIELFVAEADDLLKALNRKVLELERSGVASRDDLIVEILRDAHTLKGAASAVGQEEIRNLMHHLEGIFEGIREDRSRADPAALDLAYETLDVVAALAGATTGEPPADLDLSGLTERLESLAGGKEEPIPLALTPEHPSGPTPVAANGGGPPSESGGEEIASPSGTARSEETIRIATSKLDSIMAQVGELLVATERWKDTVSGVRALLENGEDQTRAEHVLVADLLRALKADVRVMDQSVNGLQNEVRRARMLPVSTLFDSIPRMVRDLAREQDKEVRLQIDGSDTEVDRAVLEQLKAPLNHLLRNCIDHGLESATRRHATGKPEEGTITLSAAQLGSTVEIVVADDGLGIDTTSVRSKAVEVGLIDEEGAAGLDEREALQLIFRAGLSTSPILTDVSGRGVGLDVVRENVEQLNGKVSVESELGLGTRFTLTLPLTVVTTKCLLVRVGDTRYALPVTGITRTVRVDLDKIERVNGGEAISVEGEPVRLARLADVLGAAYEPDIEMLQFPALVVSGDTASVALAADELLSAQDLVVKPLPHPLGRVTGIAGASILGDGEIVFVLNVADLGREPERRSPRMTRTADPTSEGSATVVLLADDSITTRTLEKNILESAGYRVLVASDGAEAWMLLQSEGADIAVCDVQMPHMDGFELAEKIRNDDRFTDLPVILVTSLDSPEDRARGIEAGADAYITKGAFDQEHLLDTIRRLA